MLRNGEEEKPKNNHDDFNDTAKVTEDSKDIVNVSGVVDAFFIEEYSLSKNSFRILICKRLYTILRTYRVKVSLLRHRAYCKPAIECIVCVLLHYSC